MKFWEWLKERRKRYEALVESKPARYQDNLYIVPYKNGLYVSIDQVALYYYGIEILENIICDLIYGLLKQHAVIAKDMEEEITPAGFGTMVDRVEDGLLRDAFLYKDAQGYTYIYIKHFNKFEICQYVIVADIMEFADSNRLYAVGNDVSDQLKSGELVAEECIEEENYDFYIAPGGDRNGIVIYRPSHEYDDIIEVIKEVMAPYGLKVEYRSEDEEEKNREEVK